MMPIRGTLPTLTEVIEIEAESEAMPGASAPPALESMPMESDAGLAAQAALDDQRAALAVAVLDALDPRIDSLLEARLNAALAPQLRRMVQDVIRQVRGEMATSLHALVAQAVDDVLAQRKKP
jgi:hypothetical protein